MGNRLTRADYLMLATAGLADPVKAASSSDDELATALGTNEKVLLLREAMSPDLLSAPRRRGLAPSCRAAPAVGWKLVRHSATRNWRLCAIDRTDDRARGLPP